MKRSFSKNDPFVGVWRMPDEYYSNLCYRISKAKRGYSVVAWDTEDGEKADIFEEKWNVSKGIFSFAAHWNSTGRFVRYQFRALWPKQLELTYTFTDTGVLVPAKAKK